MFPKTLRSIVCRHCMENMVCLVFRLNCVHFVLQEARKLLLMGFVFDLLKGRIMVRVRLLLTQYFLLKLLAGY